MEDLERIQNQWENLGERNALWSILTDPTKRSGTWDVDSFFQTGRNEIATVTEYVKSQVPHFEFAGSALDFGCGAGRLTQALTDHFEKPVGLDISAPMIRLANRYNEHPEKCSFVVNQKASLSQFEDESFNFIYSSVVLQHMPVNLISGYLTEFVRVLLPEGLLVFQVADREVRRRPSLARIANHVRVKLAIRSRVKGLTAFMSNPSKGKSDSPTKKVEGFEMHCIDETRVRQILSSANATVLDVQLTNSTDADFNGNLLYLDQEQQDGYVSKQYIITK